MVVDPFGPWMKCGCKCKVLFSSSLTVASSVVTGGAETGFGLDVVSYILR